MEKVFILINGTEAHSYTTTRHTNSEQHIKHNSRDDKDYVLCCSTDYTFAKFNNRQETEQQ